MVVNLQNDKNIESTIVRRQIGISVSECIFPDLSNKNTGNYNSSSKVNFGEQSHRFHKYRQSKTTLMRLCPHFNHNTMCPKET